MTIHPLRMWWWRWQDRHPMFVPVTVMVATVAFVGLGLYAASANAERDAQVRRDLAACVATTGAPS